MPISAQLVNDNGVSNTDRITNSGLVQISGLTPGFTWQYSVNFGRSWITGVGSSFMLGAGNYANGFVQVREMSPTRVPSSAVLMTSMVIDTTAISVNMTADETTVNLQNPTKLIRLVLSENAGTTLTADDFTIVGGGTVTQVTQSGNVRTAIYVPDPNNGGGTVTISLASNKFTDLAGNANVDGNDANNSISFYVDVVPPSQATVLNIDTDTFAGNVVGKNEDNDNLTRDTNLVLTGVLDKALESGDIFDVSHDGGITWSSVGSDLVLTGSTTWRYIDPILRTAGAVEYTFRVRDVNGNITLTSRVVTFDTELPVLLNAAPLLLNVEDSGVLGDNITTQNNLSFNSTQYSALEANSTIALVQDVNEDGKYQAGVDRILSTAVVNDNLEWSLNTGALALGAVNLGFVQWDLAGNLTTLSATTRIQVVASDNFIYRATGGFNLTSTTTSAHEVIYTAGFGNAIDQNGNLLFAVRSNVVTQTSQTSGSVVQNALTTANDDIANTTLLDYNRDGFLDIFASANDFAGNAQQIWTGNANGYSASRIALSNSGGRAAILAYDKEGDGFLDAMWGDWGGDGYNAIVNNSGTLTADVLATRFGSANALTMDREVSAVDLDNDGDIDVTMHTTNVTGQADDFALTLFRNNGQGVFDSYTTVARVFNNILDDAETAVSMTWADFDHDGDMDLFVGRSWNDAGNAVTDTSYIYRNDNGAFSTATRTSLADTLAGGSSIAVDWDADGKVDIIELPNHETSANINFYKNTNSNAGSMSFAAAVSLTTTNQSAISGASAVDIDWDGDLDLVYTVNGAETGTSTTSTFREIENTNQVANGSSLHLRIVDKNGINSLYGNTVNLYDQSGNFIAARVLNAQSGIGVNDSTALVYFNGLNPNQNYTAVLIRTVNGSAQDVGGVANINTIGVENINTSWTGLVASKATQNYVLTAESNSESNNSVQAGTGYNDVFFGTAGDDTFRGAGGWNKSFSSSSGSTYSATQGMDEVDYKLATAAISANLNTGTATGQGNDSLSGIEGLKGSRFNDTFTDSTANNEFEGRAGDDTINLANGGRDTLIYEVYDKASNNGGNGFDTINNFTVGNLASVANADAIDLRGLLKAYTGNVSVYWDSFSNQYVLDQSALGLLQYLKVEVVGADTIISIDSTGNANFSNTVKLVGVNTSLPDLIANNQLTYGQTDYVESLSYVFIDRISSTDTTPIIRGQLSNALQNGDTLTISLNGKSYSYPTGAVQVDNVNKTWALQLPNADALSVGTYQINAVVKNASGTTLAQDITTNELQVVANPGLILNAQPADTTDATNKAVAMTMGENGQWRFFANGSMLDATGNSLANVGNFANNALKGNQAAGFVGAASFIDFDRDGDMDLFGNDSNQADGQQAYENRGAGYTQPSVTGNIDAAGNIGYYAFQVGSVGYNDGGARVDYSGTGDTSAHTNAPYAGIIGFDKIGDGFVDLAYGDYQPNDSETGAGKDSTFVQNSGTLTKGGSNPNFQKDPGLVFTATTGSYENTQAQADKMISSVDLNNDGAVDVVYWASVGSNVLSNTTRTTYTTTSTNANRLVVVSSDGTNSATLTANFQVTQIIENLFNAQMGDSLAYDGMSMTWADFNGDGYLDLFQSSTFGTVYNTTAAGSTNGWNSKIFFNDGTGKLSAIAPAAVPSGINSGFITNDQSKTYVFDDRSRGGGSVAVDWNADGKMDIIEIPFYAGANVAAAQPQNVFLYTRNNNAFTTTGTNAYDQSILVNLVGTAATADAINGLLTVDVDWDGDKDAIFFTGNAGTTLVTNNSNVAVGTALHLRILDQQGINALIGNTVKLYDSHGVLVATQIINPQSGNQTSDSSAIVDFYGLNANERYNAVLIRNVAGVSQNVGGAVSIGDENIQNVNTAWKSLKTGAATDAYVLTAESGTALNDANRGNGIVGTGYNDNFFATLGSDKFEGGGGSTIVSGQRVWNSTTGMDIVDYKLASNSALNVNLSLLSAQNTGFGTQTFSNIEGLKGAAGNDTFTDSIADNSFEGREGNDTFNLLNGGRDTLVFDVYNTSDLRGGNGFDSANNFSVGSYNATANADRIDLRGLLQGYTGSLAVVWDSVTGRYQLDQASQGVLSYLNVAVIGSDTVISVDRTGTGNFSAILKLNNVSTTLADLLANEQIIRTESSFYLEPTTVLIDRQITTDTTPIIKGTLNQALQVGDTLSITINGKTYSSSNGVVVVDPVNNNWHVQLPVADVLPIGTYQVNAVVRNSANVTLAQDISLNELKVEASNALSFNASTNTVDALNKAVGMTVGETGQYRFYANGSIFDAVGNTLGNIDNFSQNVLRGNQVNQFIGSGSFVDFDRDGDMDFMGQDAYYQDGYQAFEYISPTYSQPSVANNTDAAGNSTYFAFQVGSTTYGNNGNRVQYSGSGDSSAHPYVYYGGFAAFDKIGDGYADFILGDSTPNDADVVAGKDSQIVQNSGTKLTANTNPNFQKDPGLVDAATTGTNLSYESGQGQADKMLSSVDLNNDGAVDLVYWATTGTNKISNTASTTFTGTSNNANRMVVVSNDGTNSATVTANFQVTQIIENTMHSSMGDSAAYDGISMTWADFNGDGFLDLFMGTTFGSVNNNTTDGATNGWNSKILFNDGTGKLAASTALASGINANFIANDQTKTYVFNDKSRGGGSVAVDWNADGRMDIIETPFYSGANVAAAQAQSVFLYTRNANSITATSTNAYDQTTLINMVGNAATADAITGLVTADLDWDGDKDAIFFTGNAGNSVVSNNTVIAAGTSLHLRILDQLGANTLIGNTVKLFNAQGQLVASQIINPQSGNQTSETSAIVDFYGLSASQTYTAVMHRNIGGASQDVGGVASIGGISVENVNASWTGLKAAAATDAYVLTAEAGNANNNSTVNGIIGTGYNDTFFATLGNDKFEGGGGSSFVSGTRAWSNTGGMDIVDYTLAANTAITANLSVATAQNTGFGTQTLSNIEGLKGASGNDSFTDNNADNSFEGRGGNDSYNLANGGRDTLIYKLLDSSATGGNANDTVTNFSLGVYNGNTNADRIDLSELISAYNGPSNGVYINGVASISADSSSITNFVSTQVVSGNTQVFVDLDGTGSAYSSTLLLTMNNVQTNLATLLANQQLIA